MRWVWPWNLYARLQALEDQVRMLQLEKRALQEELRAERVTQAGIWSAAITTVNAITAELTRRR